MKIKMRQEQDGVAEMYCIGISKKIYNSYTWSYYLTITIRDANFDILQKGDYDFPEGFKIMPEAGLGDADALLKVAEDALSQIGYTMKTCKQRENSSNIAGSTTKRIFFEGMLNTEQKGA